MTFVLCIPTRVLTSEGNSRYLFAVLDEFIIGKILVFAIKEWIFTV